MTPESSEGSNQISLLLSEGVWDENTSWEFFVDNNRPRDDLCTAVCCVLVHEGNLLLVRNKRGLELPAGKIEEGESPDEAVQREIIEETRAKCTDLNYFGYKKLTSQSPVSRPDKPNTNFPFPHSYVVYYHAVVESFDENPIKADVSETIQVGLNEAQALLSPGKQYENIIEYLIQKEQIMVKP